MEKLSFKRPIVPTQNEAGKGSKMITPRNAKEDLINQIVSKMNVDEERAAWLRKMIAVQTNTFNFTTTDLHAVLSKHNDPDIRNYTAWVTWRFGLNKKKNTTLKADK